MLCEGEMSVSVLNKQLDLSQSVLSQHLAVLRSN
jgi:DNA-binding transcriptional ArsR family regulator